MAFSCGGGHLFAGCLILAGFGEGAGFVQTLFAGYLRLDFGS
jgi:hypothetical protein